MKKASGVVGLAVAAIMGLSSATQANELDWMATPLYGSVTLSAGFPSDPHVTQIKAGGDTSAARAVGGDCLGYVNAAAPDINLDYEAGFLPLYIYATADVDTTLVVFDPNGNWLCNDDFSSESGVNPGIRLNNPPSGNYNIWVGTYRDTNETPDATVQFSELRPNWSSATQSASSSDTRDSSGIRWGDDSSRWANDGECDDPRFGGPGAHHNNLESDRYRDATDCRTLYEQGRIHLR